jgi:hypothetical protein
MSSKKVSATPAEQDHLSDTQGFFGDSIVSHLTGAHSMPNATLTRGI